jgi:hypothetical protein
MRRLIWVLAVVLSLSAGLPSSAGADPPNSWTPLGPSAAQVLALAASAAAPSTLYAATENRIWKRTTPGGAWTATGSGPAALAQSIVVDPADGDRVVAATTSCKVWVSADGGAMEPAADAVPRRRLLLAGACLVVGWSVRARPWNVVLEQ